MEMLQLRYFYESAQTESFAKTSEKYMVPTTSVSAAVKRLENELGCRLFDRTHNRILLNENGRKFQQTLCRVFAELDSAVEEMAAKSGDEREIRMLVRGMRRKITDLIIKYNQKYPHVAFQTAFDFKESDFSRYDIIIDEQKDAYPDYERFELCSIRLRLKCIADDPLCGRKLVLQQLSNRVFVSMGEESNMQKILWKVCKREGFTPKIAASCNDIECYEKLIASGIGIGLGTEEPYRLEPKVECLDVVDFDERYTIYVYYKKAACYGNVKSFLEFLQTSQNGHN